MPLTFPRGITCAATWPITAGLPGHGVQLPLDHPEPGVVSGMASRRALKVAISTHFHAGADPARARAIYRYYHEYLRPKRPGGRGFVVSRAAFDAGTSRQGAIMIGSADEITGKLIEAVKALGLDRIFAQVDWGGLPAGLVEDSIGRYATEIAPALRAA